MLDKFQEDLIDFIINFNVELDVQPHRDLIVITL
jgi:hypothetical protein